MKKKKGQVGWLAVRQLKELIVSAICTVREETRARGNKHSRRKRCTRNDNKHPLPPSAALRKPCFVLFQHVYITSTLPSYKNQKVWGKGVGVGGDVENAARVLPLSSLTSRT